MSCRAKSRHLPLRNISARNPVAGRRHPFPKYYPSLPQPHSSSTKHSTSDTPGPALHFATDARTLRPEMRSCPSTFATDARTLTPERHPRGTSLRTIARYRPIARPTLAHTHLHRPSPRTIVAENIKDTRESSLGRHTHAGNSRLHVKSNSITDKTYISPRTIVVGTADVRN